MTMETVSLLILFVIVLLLCYTLWRYTVVPLLVYGPLLHKFGVSWPGGLPPPVGHLLMPFRDSEETAHMIENFCRKHRDKILYFWRGNRPMLMLVSPELIGQVLQSPELLKKGPNYKTLRLVIGDGIVVSGGEKWKRRRKLVKPAFHISAIKSYFDTINEQTAKLVNVISEISDKKSIVDIQDVTRRYSLDIICKAAMGVYPDALKGSGCDYYLDSVSTFAKLLFKRTYQTYLWFDWVYFLTSDGRKLQAAIDNTNKFCSNVIRRHQLEKTTIENKLDKGCETKEPREDLSLLDLLLQNQETSDPIIDDDGLQEEINTFILAGHDSTSAALTWTLQCVAENTEIQDRLFGEIQETLSIGNEKGLSENLDKEITFQDLSRLVYMNQVISETLRLYSASVVLVREVEVDTVININGESVTLPQGVILSISPYVVHRDPKIYPNPEKFDPSRFETDKVRSRHPYAYIPFSSGPRNCIGQRFAMTEIKTALVGILRKFKILAMQSTGSLGISPDFVLRPRLPVMLKFIPR